MKEKEQLLPAPAQGDTVAASLAADWVGAVPSTPLGMIYIKTSQY